ncbi:MAG: hypothetical protein N3G20_09130, partial [Verrucomicrobiae bacterium]|nr:hypothetical protein [Verrucomicrobiae bacterium]
MNGGDVYCRFFPPSTLPPRFGRIGVANGRVSVSLHIVPGVDYTLEISTNLIHWEPVGTVNSDATSVVELVDDEPPFGRLFARARTGAWEKFEFFVIEFAHAGSFGGGTTATVSFPVVLSGYSAVFGAYGRGRFPAASEVYFTGPPGSGLTNTPAKQSYQGPQWIMYASPLVAAPTVAPPGQWVVKYKGSNVQFDLPDPEAVARFVVPVPSVTVEGDRLQIVSWVYKTPRNGA